MSFKFIAIPEGIDYIDNDYITQLCHGNIEEIEEVKLPKSLKYIGQQAFKGCSRLKEINFPENLTDIEDSAFASCFSLEHIELNEKLEVIGSFAFYGCNLEKVYIPKNVDTIRTAPFMQNKNLKEIIVDKENKYFKDFGCNVICNDSCLIQGCSTSKIPSKIIYINKNAFEGANIKEIEIPGNIERIYDYAFYNTGLEYLNLDEGINTIGRFAFAGNIALDEITFPKTLDIIHPYAFISCNLKEITIKGKTTILDMAFDKNENLDNVYIYNSECKIMPNTIKTEKTNIYTVNDLKDKFFLKDYKKQIRPLNLDSLIEAGKSFKEANTILNQISKTNKER